MDNARIDRETRRVRMGTLHGTIEGSLRVSSNLRTLDFLNRSTAKFISIQDPRVTSARWQPAASTSFVNVSFVLWVAEIIALQRTGRRRATPLQNRSGIRLCMPECEVLGFVHTPAQGDPILRLNQDTAPFFALTSASLLGPDIEFAAAFLAVNRAHVFAAEAFASAVDELEIAQDVRSAAEPAWGAEP